MKFIFKVILIGTILISSVNADTYIYKDQQGHWTFSDKPLPGLTLIKILKDEKQKPLPVQNIAAKLKKQYSPQTAIEHATLSVVAIKTPLVRGSGFFITNNGYILTNKHVVSPYEMEESWKKERKEISEFAETVNQLAKNLLKINSLHDHWRNEYEGCEKNLYRPHYRARKFKELLADWKKFCKKVTYNYQQLERELELAEHDYYTAKNELDKVRWENFKNRSEAMFARTFKITLKDESEHQATLIASSKIYDLALLKLDHVKTPFLNTQTHTLGQGSRVYAIGLFGQPELKDKDLDDREKTTDKEKKKLLSIMLKGGLKDSVTSGVITRTINGYIFTDSDIYSGYSGGPLVNEQGDAVGINTLVWSQEGGIEHRGFGIAISVDIAMKEFKKYLLK